MTTTPASESGSSEVLALGPSPWEIAAARAEAGEVVRLSDNTGEHRFVVLTEEQYLALEEAAEDAEHRDWQIRNRDRLHAERARILAGERGTPASQLRAEAEAELAQSEAQ